MPKSRKGFEPWRPDYALSQIRTGGAGETGDMGTMLSITQLRSMELTGHPWGRTMKRSTDAAVDANDAILRMIKSAREDKTK